MLIWIALITLYDFIQIGSSLLVRIKNLDRTYSNDRRFELVLSYKFRAARIGTKINSGLAMNRIKWKSNQKFQWGWKSIRLILRSKSFGLEMLIWIALITLYDFIQIGSLLLVCIKNLVRIYSNDISFELILSYEFRVARIGTKINSGLSMNRIKWNSIQKFQWGWKSILLNLNLKSFGLEMLVRIGLITLFDFIQIGSSLLVRI